MTQGRLLRLWHMWAPPVLAAGGDPLLEDLAFQRPGVKAARTAYDQELAVRLREARQDQDAALTLTLILRTRCECGFLST